MFLDLIGLGCGDWGQQSDGSRFPPPKWGIIQSLRWVILREIKRSGAMVKMVVVVVVVVVVGAWPSRVWKLRGLTDAPQCRVIAENGLGVNLICQYHEYTGCTSPVITNGGIIRILIRRSASCVYTSVCPSPPKFLISSRLLYQPRILHRSQHGEHALQFW